MTPRARQHLAPRELIVGIELPPSTFADHSWYLKVRDRHSYAFALVSVAAGLRIEDGVITAAAVALGGVAATPWRVADAEAGLIGPRPTSGISRGRRGGDGWRTTVAPERVQGRPRQAYRGAGADEGIEQVGAR